VTCRYKNKLELKRIGFGYFCAPGNAEPLRRAARVCLLHSPPKANIWENIFYDFYVNANCYSESEEYRENWASTRSAPAKTRSAPNKTGSAPIKQAQPPIKQAQPPIRQAQPPLKQAQPPIRQTQLR